LSKVREQTAWQCSAVHVQMFYYDLANAITESIGDRELTDCSVMVFMNEFTNYSSIFSFFQYLVALNISDLQLTPNFP
jgi:hypothetical protein